MKRLYYSNRIKEYGKDILDSKEFLQGVRQIHHLRTLVAAHSLRTAKIALKICDRLERCGLKVDERRAVRAALLHDLGMLGRSQRYKNNFECGYRHPINSVATARKIWPDIDPKSINAIKSHMWPLSLSVPSSKEAFIVCFADKMASIADIFPKKGKKNPC
ncbi:MAG: HD domain-containing protein [Butyrivibrio sp.]|nr:HD domain-containing protein [Butyrivibrio sp.]